MVIPSMWISAQERPVWSLSASELIPWAEVRGAATRRGNKMLRSLGSILCVLIYRIST